MELILNCHEGLETDDDKDKAWKMTTFLSVFLERPTTAFLRRDQNGGGENAGDAKARDLRYLFCFCLFCSVLIGVFYPLFYLGRGRTRPNCFSFSFCLSLFSLLLRAWAMG